MAIHPTVCGQDTQVRKSLSFFFRVSKPHLCSAVLAHMPVLFSGARIPSIFPWSALELSLIALIMSCRGGVLVILHVLPTLRRPLEAYSFFFVLKGLLSFTAPSCLVARSYLLIKGKLTRVFGNHVCSKSDSLSFIGVPPLHDCMRA